MTSEYRINTGELMYAVPPFSYEFVESRPVGQQWRIRDSRDDAYGSATDEDAAKQAVERLNK